MSKRNIFYSKVSIIIVNFKGKIFLEGLFSSIKKLTYPNLEIIFVDNSPEEGNIRYVKENFPKVEVVENNKNLGFSLANNQGAKIAKGEYLFFLNNDTKVNSDALLILVKKMEEDKNIGICGCRMMSYDGKRYFHTGIGLDIFGYPVLKDKIFYVEGSALMIRKELFEKLGGFDEKYFMFHEDIDLCWRARLLGYKIAVAPEAVIYHYAGGSAGGGEIKGKKYETSYLRRYYSERNNIRTLLKNYEIKTLLFILPFYFLINLGEIILFFLTLRWKVVYLYLKAYIWNLINLPDTFQERKKIQKLRKIPDKEIMKNMYFGSGKFLAFLKVRVPKFR